MFHDNRILIVDDDPQFIRLLERIFRNQFLTEGALSGEEALVVARVFQPDLILLDINMPGMDGYETCRRLRENENSRLFKVFMVSSKGSLDDRLIGYEAGADDYVTKPFDREELLAKIHVFLHLRRSEEVDCLKSQLLEILASSVLDPVKQIMDRTGELINDPQTPNHLWDLLSSIYKNAIDLNRFVGKADRLHRLRQHGIELHYSRDSLKTHLLSMIRQWGSAVQQKGLRVVCDILDGDDISVDWGALDEVVNYLFDNAVRYSEEGGEIVISVFQNDERCLIQFRNQGQVIDSNRHMNSIFAPFYVQDLEHHHEGHGLSLAIAKELIAAHHGHIDVDNGPDGITVFTINIPVSGCGTPSVVPDALEPDLTARL